MCTDCGCPTTGLQLSYASVAGKPTDEYAWDREPWASRRRAALKRRSEARRAAWWATYRRYLASPEWRAKRAAAMQSTLGTCHECLAAAEQVHHLTYERVGDEDPGDLAPLCRSCHERAHAIEVPSW